MSNARWTCAIAMTMVIGAGGCGTSDRGSGVEDISTDAGTDPVADTADEDTTDDDTNADEADTNAGPMRNSDGTVVCCSIPERWDCGCFHPGGAQFFEGECDDPRTWNCDSDPSEWEIHVDAYGCQYITFGGGSCWPPP